MNTRKFQLYLQTGEYVPAEDAAPASLAAHDKRFHPDGFNPEKDHCEFREKMEKGDESDAIPEGDAPKAESLPKDSAGREVDLQALTFDERERRREEALERLRKAGYGTEEYASAKHDLDLYYPVNATKCESDNIPATEEELNKKFSWGWRYFQTPDGSVWKTDYSLNATEAFPVQHPGAVPYKTPDMVAKEKAAAEAKERKKREKAELLAKKREFDKPYSDAVAAGDMKKAQEIVEEVAKLSGYSSDNSWRMSHSAPNAKDGDVCLADIEVDEDGRIVSQGPNDVIPEDFFSNYRDYRMGTDGEFAVASEIRSALIRETHLRKKYPDGSRHATITLYRGVDKKKNAKEGSFRNGDWVTADYAYAKNEAEDASNEKPRVIKMTVPLNHVYWDVNSVMEMGYDDGKNYAYADVPNNRKLLDTVVRDDAGKVIPISKRFDRSKSDPRF